MKNEDSYTTAVAIGLAAKGLGHNWIYLGRQREPGMLRAFGPVYLNHDRTLSSDFYPVPVLIKMQIQISQ